MRGWWKSLRPREQGLVAGAALFSCVVLFYLLVWEPLQQDRHDVAMRVKAHQETLAWMRQASTRIKTLRAQSPTVRRLGTQRSLLSVLDDSAKRAKIRETIQRMEPEGRSGVKLRLEGVEFDALVRWLGTLETQYGVQVARASLTRTDAPGRIDARLSLSRP